MNLDADELRAIANLLDQLDQAETTARVGQGLAITGDIPVRVGDTHILVGHATDEYGEGHTLRIDMEVTRGA